MNEGKKMEKEKSSSQILMRAITEFLILLSVFGLAGYLIYVKIDKELTESLEESVALNSQSIAYGLNKQFDEEFQKLESCAALAEKGEMTYQNLIDVSVVRMIGESMGILTREGELIIGDPISEEEFALLKNVFEGERTIKYRKEYGLIFAIPIKVNGQTCLLYDHFTDDAFRKKFNALSYNGKGALFFINGYQQNTVVKLSEETGDINFYNEMKEGRKKLKDKYFSSDRERAAAYYNFNGEKYFLHLSEINPKYRIAIVGYVSWEHVAVGIDYIYYVMLATFIIVLIALILGVRYLMKTREAETFENEKIMADTANNAKSEFLSNMSHEIRTPINAIMGMNEMVIRETKDRSILEYSENLQNAARTLLGLVNDILDFSKIEAGKMEIIPVEYHVSSILNDLVHMIESRAEKKGLDFRINVSSDVPSVLFGDEIRIKQIITNILTNAVKYTEKGGVTLNVTSRKIDDEKIYLCVSVADTGIGIKEEDIEKLFNAFERIEESRNRNIEGTGLGMNITQRLLSMMGSQLIVESNYGHGSTFGFQVEQKIINPTPIGDFQQDYKNSLSQRKKYQEKFTAPDAHILVVDDTVMNLTVVKGLLKQTKIKIETAINGFECLEKVKHKKYDLILLDHRMPGMDGIETLKAMKEMSVNLNENTPVISLTANAISGAREEYIAAGFDDYLTKPINSVHLENMLQKYLPPQKILPAAENEIESEEEFFKNLPDWLEKVEGLDLKEGIEHCGGVEEYLDALKIFAQSIKSASNDIEKFFEKEDWKSYTIKVHALKSSARVIGADELSEKARRLEDAGNSNYTDEIKKDTQPLLDLYRSYLTKLQPLIEIKENDSDKPLIDEGELNEAFETMKEISASFDYDSLMFVIQSLDEYKLPDEKAKIFAEIKNAATNLDWEKIKTLLKE